MAAAFFPVAANAGQSATKFASQEFHELEADPLGYIVRRCIRYGWIALGSGFAMSFVGFLLRTAGTRAGNDEAAFIQQETAIFNNLGAPTLPALSWNLGQDVGTALDDAATVAAWVPQEVFNGVSDIGQAIWLGLKNIPRLLNDDLWIVLGFTAGNLMDFAFPFFILGGGILLAVGYGLQLVQKLILPRARIAVRAKWSLWVEQPLDRAFGISTALPVAEKEELHEAAVAAAGAPTPDPVAAVAAETQAEALAEPLPNPPPNPLPDPLPAPPEPSVVPVDVPAPPEPEPTLEPPTPTADVESLLGEPEAIEPTAEELRKMESERLKTLEPAEPIYIEPFTIQPEPKPSGKTMAALVGDAFGTA